jgi:hypothetical protein
VLFRVCSRDVFISSRKDVWHSPSFSLFLH